VPLAAQPEAPAREKSLGLLSRASGLPLDAYKPDHVERQIEAAMRSEGVSNGDEMAALMSRSAAARRRFRGAIAISVSGHLRDPHQFDLLRDEILPQVLERDGMIRVWSAGCADGSELYDLGGMLQAAGVLERTYLLGSDILDENLVAARDKQSFVANPKVRARVRWEQRDLATERPPPGVWRLVLCRNVAIYLRPEVRDDLHGKLAAALAPDGFLMLGRSERVMDPGFFGLQPVAPNVYRNMR
jgi:chemotaxis protein methyltransferase CheR